MTSPENPTDLIIKPSRRRTQFLLGVHAVAAFSLLFLPRGVLGLGAAGVLALLLVTALVFYLARSGIAATVLRVGDGGAICLDPERASARQGQLTAGTVVLGGVVWLAWTEEGGRSGGLMLLADQLQAEDWRRLQRWLRLCNPVARAAGVATRRKGVSPGGGPA